MFFCLKCRQTLYLTAQFAAEGPESQSWIWNEGNLFAIKLVVAIAKPLRAVAREHSFQIAILKADTFNLFSTETSGTPPDCKTSFGGAVYEVSSRAQVAGEIRIPAHRLKRRRSSTIAVFADQDIDGWVFTECSYARREKISSALSASAMRVR